MNRYLSRLEAVENKLAVDNGVLVVFLGPDEDQQEAIARAAAARGISPEAAGLQVIIVRWVTPSDLRL